jgi:undecaprenyl diphosphate synthase
MEGLKAAKRVVAAAADLGISYVTLYVFSTENWKRAQDEVGFLMGLINKHLLAEMGFYRENGIRIRHAGNLEGLPPNVAAGLRKTIAETADCMGMTLCLAINYGGRDELIRAVKKAVLESLPLEEISEQALSDRMDNPDIPDPDLIIRTASEHRLSNFLIWEAAYAEYYFSDKFWPDWDREDLVKALENFAGRERRFGGIKT